MGFKREIRARYYADTENIWIDNPYKAGDGMGRLHIVGAWIMCKVVDEESGLNRSSSFTLSRRCALEEKDCQGLIEEHFLLCERILKYDMENNIEL